MSRVVVDVSGPSEFARELRQAGPGTIIRYGLDHADDRKCRALAARAAGIGLGALHWMRVEGQLWMAPVFVRTRRQFDESVWHRSGLPEHARARLEREASERLERAEAALSLHADGFHTAEIAQRFGISERSVRDLLEIARERVA